MKGIGGTLFPAHYLRDCVQASIAGLDSRSTHSSGRRLYAWWTRVESSCGPATSVRALFDIAAMPLFGLLGFRAAHAVFDERTSRAQLRTPAGTPVALVVLRWAARPSSSWRGAVTAAAESGAHWCFLFAPPYLSLVAAAGTAVRRSVEFTFPVVLAGENLERFLSLTLPAHFDLPGAGRGSRLDQFVEEGAAYQDAVRSDLQDGVLDALERLVPAIRLAGRRRTDAFQEALTLLYRILFLLFAESRDLLPHRHPVYRQSYALATLCRLAMSPDPPRGLWDALAAVTRISRAGCRVDDLIVRPFNGRLFARASAPSLEPRRPSTRPTRASSVRDRAMRHTLVALSTRRAAGGREEICYRDLGVEQLGAVYERVLDLDPETIGPTLRRPSVHGRRRKESGTFYTPQDLAELVVRRTLTPLVAGRSSDEILALRVLDPAMGSGAFLVATCRFLAAACERALIEEGRWSEGDVRREDQVELRRLVAERCLAGVDVNPVAVQLARLSLWLATLADGRPLGFLDHRLRTGNSLVGASPEDLHREPGHTRGRRFGIAAGQLSLLDNADLQRSLRRAVEPLIALSHRRDDSVEDVRAKEALWSSLAGARSPLAPWRGAADLWCARWFWPADAGPAPAPSERRAAFDALLRSDRTIGSAQLGRWLRAASRACADRRFFHWPLEFTEMFYDADGLPKENPGFDAVVGNPPWEMLRDDDRANPLEPTGDRGRDPKRLVRFIRESGHFPNCDRGHVNLYQPFLERAVGLVRPQGGRVGLVLPWGLAVDDGAAGLRDMLFEGSAVEELIGIDNVKGIFPIHRGVRFMALVARTGGRTEEVRARFGVHTREHIAALADDDARTEVAPLVPLHTNLLSRLTGSLRRIPDIRHTRELRLIDRLTRDYPRLGAPDGFGASFGRELNATDDRESFGREGLPILEGKHLTPFVADVNGAPHRIAPSAAARRLPSRPFSHARLAYRDVSGVSNRVSLIAAVVPAGALTSHTVFCLRTPLPVAQQHYLCGVFNSFVLNAFVRPLMGGHLTTSLVERLPVPPWCASPDQQRIARLALRLAGPRRSPAVMALLQAAVARLYGVDRDALAGLLEGFPLVPASERALVLRACERRPRRLRYSPG